MDEETKQILSEAQLKIAEDPEERKRRSDRAKRQHKEGNLGRTTWKTKKTAKPRICSECIQEFIPELTPSGIRSQSEYCISCRPPHYGGQYKYWKRVD